MFGLNVEKFCHTSSSLLSQDPLPSLDRACNILKQEERLHNSKVSGGFRPGQKLGGAAGSVGTRGATGPVQDVAGGTILVVSGGTSPRQ
ncbi:hypothetical protein LIER_04397 [Lithospermum erythrorhizon]|uniref:Uncharacterized protein n=1 Tax=Lithospermum erythrorhizon TaxID=34254 RepID=A0AAV3NZC2_LITER